MAATRAVFIVAAKRTPFGTFGGALKALSATELGVIASRAALAVGNVCVCVSDIRRCGLSGQTCCSQIRYPIPGSSPHRQPTVWVRVPVHRQWSTRMYVGITVCCCCLETCSVVVLFVCI